MEKRGLLGTFTIIGIVITLIGVGAGIYAYQFYVFKTLRVCISDRTIDSKVECLDNQECIGFFMNSTGMQERIQDVPEFIKVNLIEISEEAVYCESTCRAREVYGDITGESIESCEEGDKEILIEIRGKEGLEMLNYLRTHRELLSQVGERVP